MSTSGKYRAVVAANGDPLRLGRVQAIVPEISADPLGWALPCVPYAPPAATLPLPPVGTSIWVEFEGGDTGRPIWSGCFWDAADAAPRFEPL